MAGRSLVYNLSISKLEDYHDSIMLFFNVAYGLGPVARFLEKSIHDIRIPRRKLI